VYAVGKVLVYEGTWVGVARCWNRLKANHVLTQLRDEVCWDHWMLGRRQEFAGDPQGFSVH
jgi:hypothetical protein